MLATLGDLVDDVVVRLEGSINEATDTVARIERRRGGSAANTAVAAAELDGGARFLGQVGDDPIGAMLVGELAAAGVDVGSVVRGGRSGTIVVLVDLDGERTMLSDRGACVDLNAVDPSWLDDVTTLHVPMYSFAEGHLAQTARAVVASAHERGARVSVDVSSVELIERFGTDRVSGLLGELRPSVVFANRDEADVLSIDGPFVGAVTVVKRGAGPVTVYTGSQRFDFDVPGIGHVADTTGAGDAFAAGYLSAAPHDVATACATGCAAAARLLRSR